MEPLLPSQIEQLKTWAAQRDAILLENSVLRNENLELSKKIKEFADSKTLIEAEINQAQGRLNELNIREAEYEEIVSTKLSELLIKKTQVETEITHLENEIQSLKDKKDLLIENIAMAEGLYDRVYKQIPILEGIVDRVTKASVANEKDVITLVTNLKASLKEVTDINNQNVKETLNVIGEAPRLFFEIQRQVLTRPKIK